MKAFAFEGPIALAALVSALSSHHQPPDPTECTLFASGGDDGSAFLHATQHCREVTIPKHTTLNISTRLNMTELKETHIVSTLDECFRSSALTIHCVMGLVPGGHRQV